MRRERRGAECEWQVHRTGTPGPSCTLPLRPGARLAGRGLACPAVPSRAQGTVRYSRRYATRPATVTPRDVTS